jgi:hypothetical protein
MNKPKAPTTNLTEPEYGYQSPSISGASIASSQSQQASTDSEPEPNRPDADTVVTPPNPYAAIDAIPDPWQRRILREQFQQVRGELREATAKMEALEQAIQIARGPRDLDGPPAILDLRTEILEGASTGLQQAASVVGNVAEEPAEEARERLAPLMAELDAVIAPELERVVGQARATVAAATKFLAEPVVARIPALWPERDHVRTAMVNLSNTGSGLPSVLDMVLLAVARAKKKYAELSPATVAKDSPFIAAEIANLREHVTAIPKYEAAVLGPLQALKEKAGRLRSEDVSGAATVAPHTAVPSRPGLAVSMLRDF